jgi:ribonuclease P protein component
LRFFLKKTDRILKRSEFLGLSKTGRTVRGEFFIAVVAPSRSEKSRLGVTVSRKVGGAVQRNRIKRLTRDFFRRNRQLIKGCWDINLIARRGAAEQTNQTIFVALEDIFTRLSRQLES